MKYYHWIIENVKTGERYETITKNKKAPRHTNNYKIIGCCGFHETPDEKRSNNEIL